MSRKQTAFNTVIELAVWVGVVSAFGVSLLAQAPDPVPQRGIVPNGFYEISKIETIDAVSGNVNIRIPITSFPEGRGGFKYGVDLVYNSAIWTRRDLAGTGQYFVTPVSLDDPRNVGGWNFGFQYYLQTEIIQYPTPQVSCSASMAGEERYRMLLPDGSSHILYGLDVPAANAFGEGIFSFDYPPCGAPQYGNFYTADGTYLHVNVTPTGWTLFYPDGRTVQQPNVGPTVIADRNNNKIQIGGNGTSAILTDDLGRTITMTPIFDSTGTHLQDVITQTGFNGQPLQWTVNWVLSAPITSGHQYQCVVGNGNNVPCSGEAWPILTVGSIELPSGLSYQFQSDTTTGWGQLSQMTVPSGAIVKYTYDNDWDISNRTSGSIASKTLQWVDENSNVTRQEPSSYAFTNTTSTFTNPDGGVTSHYFYDQGGQSWNAQTHTMSGNLFPGLVYRTVQPDGSALEQVWNQNIPFASNLGGQGQLQPPFNYPANAYAQAEIKSAAAGGVSSIFASTAFVLDRNGNKTQTTESDWLAYSGNVTHSSDSNSPVITYTAGPALRTTSETHQIPTSQASSDPSALSTDDSNHNAYWDGRSLFLTSLVSREQVTGSGLGSVSEFQYDGGTLTRGNVTQETHWDSQISALTTPLNGCPQSSSPATGCNASVVTHGYDPLYGNPTSLTDALGHVTIWNYDSSSLCVASKTEGTGARHFTYGACDQSTDLPSSITDSHGITKSFGYDKFGRNTSITETDGGGVLTRHTITSYDDIDRQIVTRADLNTSADAQNNAGLSQTAWYDQLGRLRKTQDAAGNLVQSLYYTPKAGDPGHGLSYQLVSNPYLTGAEPSAGWTLTQLDSVGRPISVEHCGQQATQPPAPFSSTACSSTGISAWSYGIGTAANGNTTQTMASSDETLANETCAVSASSPCPAQRTNYTDGLGRLIQVTENPLAGAATAYSYDALNNLTGVTQSAQQRTFVYSSLGRLLSANNLESGVTSYQYDLNGNLCARNQGGSANGYCTFSGGVSTSYTYDALSQMLTKNYSDATPPVTYSYTVDWLTAVTTTSATRQNISFDGFGRVTSSSQTTNGATYTFPNYQYNLAGSLTAITYPSGRVVATSFDTAGRPSGVQNVAAGTAYASGISYAPNNAMTRVTMGNGLVESTIFNSRFQPTNITAGSLISLNFGYGATNNNGNVQTAAISRPSGTLTQYFAYDGANRLIGAQENPASPPVTSYPASFTCPSSPAAVSWCEQELFDVYGNRLVGTGTNLGTPVNVPTSISAATNRNTGGSWLYSTVGSVTTGNIITDGLGMQYTYDAENRQITAGGTSYLYDGDGQRVLKTMGATSTAYVYDVAGNLAAEYGGPAQTVRGTTYLTTDHLGSTRLVTSAANTLVNGISAGAAGTALECRDYLPFGEVLTVGRSTACASGDTGVTELFTGKKRDAETGLDFFSARYMSSAQGRFTSPDRPTIDQYPDDPQSWNLYAYVRNNPLKFRDPSGLGCLNDLGATDGGGRQIGVTNGGNSSDCGANGGTWVPGDINKNNVGFYTSQGATTFQVTTQDAGNVYYSSFVSGAKTDENGGGGASIAHASADWLKSMLVGGDLNQMMSFAAQRVEERGGGPLMALLAGPGFSLNAPDNWAGPGGRGTPQGTGDWSAMAHDYNFWNWNGGNGTDKITIGSYFSFRNSPEKIQALIQSNHNLVRNAGGAQAAKMELLFGVVNVFQSFVGSWK